MNERGLVSELPCRGFPGQDGDESASEIFQKALHVLHQTLAMCPFKAATLNHFKFLP